MQLKEYKQDDKRVLGIDENGRGPLAGPLIVTGVIFKDVDDDIKQQIKDSKKLSEKKRNELYVYLLKHTQHVVKIKHADRIDSIGIDGCWREAIQEIYDDLTDKFDVAILDGNKDPINKINFHTLIDADQYVKEVSAASIIGKVVHDKYMYEYAKKYPVYLFEKHKGYGTVEHRNLIKEYGRCPIHRKSFKIKGYDDNPYMERLKEEAKIREQLKKYHS